MYARTNYNYGYSVIKVKIHDQVSYVVRRTKPPDNINIGSTDTKCACVFRPIRFYRLIPFTYGGKIVWERGKKLY